MPAQFLPVATLKASLLTSSPSVGERPASRLVARLVSNAPRSISRRAAREDRGNRRMVDVPIRTRSEPYVSPDGAALRFNRDAGAACRPQKCDQVVESD